ncbi:MAG: hypothetical protein ACRC28_18685 [Clostridium sp.]|uniref:hypothetical protein n=1 Tax=Clostridium sp. TaxID=1506 RepID=UPI003F36C656
MIPINKKGILTSLENEVIESRKGILGRDFDNLKYRLDNDFEDLCVNDNKYAFVNNKGIGQVSVKNTGEGATKNLVIKGRTLQNIATIKSANLDKSRIAELSTLYLVQAGKTYTVISKLKTTGSVPVSIYIVYDGGGEGEYTRVGSLNECKVTIKPTKNGKIRFYYPPTDYDAGSRCSFEDIMVIEGDHINNPPSYFEGIKSSGETNNKIDILSSGKNLFNKILSDYTSAEWLGEARCCYFNVKPNTKYTCSTNAPKPPTTSLIFFNGPSSGSNGVWSDRPVTVTSDKNGRVYIALRNRNYTDSQKMEQFFDGTYYIMFEEGTIASSYEPYVEDKKEILLPVPHRGLEKIQNVYNGNTGVYIENIEKRIFNGEQGGWYIGGRQFEKCSTFYKTGIGDDDFICDKLPYDRMAYTDRRDVECITSNIGGTGGLLIIQIDRTKLISDDSNGLNDYLRKNPLTIYLKREPKTYKLKSTSLNTYKDMTHVTQEDTICGEISADFPVNQKAVLEDLMFTNKSLRETNEAIRAGNETITKAIGVFAKK